VAEGGTGVGTLTLYGVLLGNATSQVIASAAGNPYEVLRVPNIGGFPAFGAVDLGQAAAVTGLLPVAHGGTGTATPSLVEGSGISITGSWPNQTVTNTSPASALGDPVTVAHGGTGTATGSITGTGALTFAAGGTDQNVTLTPSGVGYTVLNGSVGVGTATPFGAFEIYSAGAAGAKGWIYFRANAQGAVNPDASVIYGLCFAWNPSGGYGESQILYGTGAGSAPRLEFGRWDGTTKTIDLRLQNGQLISYLATGTAPLAVTSTTLVTNLNADLVDGVHISLPLSVANGGTGTATPSLVAGSNIVITGTWPAQTVAVSATPSFTSLTVNGDLSISTDGSSQATPRVGAFVNLSSGEAARFQFGDSSNAFQLGYGTRMQLYSYWGMELRGSRQTSEPAFVAGDASDPGVSIINTVAAVQALVVKGASSQSANLQEWQNSAGTVLASISAAGVPAFPAYDGARVYNSATQSIANTTTTALTFDSERYDNGGLHSITSNTSRLTAQKAGKYYIWASVQLAGNATGTRNLTLRRNGTTGIANLQRQGLASPPFTETISTVAHLAAADYVEVTLYQDSGVSLSTGVYAEMFPEFAMQWLGP
jgi:hypothetical protein